MKDGRTITVPLAWYPKLLGATPKQRLNWKIAGGGYGIHWPDLDEDLSTEGLLRGAPALARAGKFSSFTVKFLREKFLPGNPQIPATSLRSITYVL